MSNYKRLDEVCHITMGQSPDSSSYNTEGNGLPFFQGNADFGSLYPNVRIWCNAPKKIIKPNKLLISVRAPIGALNFSREESCIGRGLAGITPLEGTKLKYIYYCLKSKKEELNQKGTGSTFKAIAKESLGETRVKSVPLGEQIKIIEKLDRISDLINLQNKQIALLEDLIRARFVELFGDVTTDSYKYDTCKLGEVAEVGSSHRVFTNEFVESGVPFYRGTEISELSNGNLPTDPFYISEEHYSRLISEGTKPQVGDLLMPSICNKGQVWMVNTENPFYYKDGRVLSISPDRNIFNSVYLRQFMSLKTESEYPKLGSGSTFAEFKIFQLKELDVLIPPRDLQNSFADFVAQIDKSKSAVQKSLDETQLLFDSLMQEYFG